LFRTRAPLPLMMYVAARENRLLFNSADSFALIEHPAIGRGPLGGDGVLMFVLRVADRRWDLMMFLVPGAGSLVLAAAMLPLRPMWPIAIVLAVAALAYTNVVMAAVLVRSVRRLYKAIWQGPDAAGAEPALSGCRRLSLCHQLDPGKSGELLRQAVSQADTGRVGETLVCPRCAVTTGHMRAAVDADPGVLTDPHEVVQSSRAVGRDGFPVLYLLALALLVLASAWSVADLEAAACAGPTCVDQATFFLGTSDLDPVTMRAWLLGRLIALAGLTAVLVIVVAVRRSPRVTGDEMRPIILVLVVKHNELEAVMTA
jgi:hypothetical protein